MNINKKIMLLKAFLSSQFSYSPQLRVFHNRKTEHKMNSIHKKVLKFVYEDSHDLSFQGLVAKDQSVFTKKPFSCSNWDL